MFVSMFMTLIFYVSRLERSELFVILVSCGFGSCVCMREGFSAYFCPASFGELTKQFLKDLECCNMRSNHCVALKTYSSIRMLWVIVLE